MDIIPKLITNVAILFIMMIPGIILKKCRLISDGFGKGISNLVLYIAQPALIFVAYLKPFDSSVLKNALIVLILSIVAHAIFSVVAMLCYRSAPDGTRRMLRFATVFSNAAFMGIPLISAIFADTPAATEVTIYASIYNITFNVFLWSLGVYICTSNRDVDGDGIFDDERIRKEKGEVSFVKVVFHPVNVAAMLGLVFFILPINQYVPKLAVDSFDMLRGLVAPLSMLVIGLRLADIDFRGFFKSIHLYICLALRHVVLPIAVFGIMVLLRLVGVPIIYEVFMVTLILAAAPAASSATMFAEKYDCDAPYITKVVTVSTLLSIITMPLLCMLVDFVYVA